MTIDDELLLGLFKPDRHGKVGEDALIVKVVGTRKIDYELEESSRESKFELIDLGIEREVVKITSDIIVTIPQEYHRKIAIELENNVHWDFGESLRQVKKYKHAFEDTRVIIPTEYKRFAPLYKNEGFRVYLWKAKRKWQCLRCGTINLNENRIPPKCNGKDSEGKKCSNKSRDEFDLVGLEDAEVKEYE
ncbi:MAG: hypothetical protein IBX40_13180 [Methanosarcinales archaeon]|nr:hypothetical protein [Methanosarcinales archaeon]